MNIREKEKREMISFGELLMTWHVIGAYPKDVHFVASEFGEAIANSARFFSAFGRVIPRIEIEKGPVSSITGKTMKFAILIRKSITPITLTTMSHGNPSISMTIGRREGRE